MGYEVHLQDFRRAGYCHADCAGGVNAMVVHAGEVELGRMPSGGLVLKRFNSCSGHFKPRTKRQLLNKKTVERAARVARPCACETVSLQSRRRRLKSSARISPSSLSLLERRESRYPVSLSISACRISDFTGRRDRLAMPLQPDSMNTSAVCSPQLEYHSGQLTAWAVDFAVYTPAAGAA